MPTKKILSVIAILFLILNIPAAHVYSDTGNTITIVTAASNRDEMPVSGVSIAIYQIAKRDGDNYRLMPKFENSNLGNKNILQDMSGAAAKDIQKIIDECHIMPDAKEKSDASGTVKFAGVSNGIYIIRQISTAANDGKYDMDPFWVEVTNEDVLCKPKGILTANQASKPTGKIDDGNNGNNTKDNTQDETGGPGAVAIILVSDTGKYLSGGKFSLYDSTGKWIGNYVTDKNGWAGISYLSYGNYYILQNEAPDGYEKHPRKIIFELTWEKSSSSQYPWVIKVINKAISQTEQEMQKTLTVNEGDGSIPETRDNNMLQYFVICFIFSIILLLEYRMKKEMAIEK